MSGLPMPQRVRAFLGALAGPRRFDEVELVRHVLGRRGQPRVMVDVGAHHGTALAPFAGQGWTVHAFEPDQHNRKVLTDRRLANVTVDPRAISERNGDLVAFYRSDISSGISTLSPFHATHQSSGTVETVRLDSYLRENRLDDVEFVKVDAEGYDLLVLRTFPFSKLHPRAVVCEFEDRKTRLLGYTHHDLATFLQAQGYIVFTSEWHPIIEYGQAHRWRRLRRYPHDLASSDSWGNFIAVDPALARRVALLVWLLRFRVALRRSAERVLRQ